MISLPSRLDLTGCQEIFHIPETQWGVGQPFGKPCPRTGCTQNSRIHS